MEAGDGDDRVPGRVGGGQGQRGPVPVLGGWGEPDVDGGGGGGGAGLDAGPGERQEDLAGVAAGAGQGGDGPGVQGGVEQGGVDEEPVRGPRTGGQGDLGVGVGAVLPDGAQSLERGPVL